MQRLLLDHCQQRHYILCPYADQVKPQYLWWQGGQFEKIGGFARSPEETWRMVLDSIRYYPAGNMVAALGATAAQLGKYQTGDGLRKCRPHVVVTRNLASVFPQEFPQFMCEVPERRHGHEVAPSRLLCVIPPPGIEIVIGMVKQCAAAVREEEKRFLEI